VQLVLCAAQLAARSVLRHLEEAPCRMRSCDPMAEVRWPSSIKAFCAVKELEYTTDNRVISSWERKHLLLLV